VAKAPPPLGGVPGGARCDPQGQDHFDAAESKDSMASPPPPRAVDDTAVARNVAWPGRIEVDIPTMRFEPLVVSPRRFRQQPYRPDMLVDGWTTRSLTVRVACVRGDAHRHGGVPRQDDVAIAFHEATGSLIVVVADGVSAAQHAHHGAAAACRYTIDAALRQLDEAAAIDWQVVVHGAAWAIVEVAQRLSGTAEPDAKAAERDYAATLSAACVRRADDGGLEVSVVSVGDSGIGVISEGQLVRLVGGKANVPDDFASSAVLALPRVPATPPIRDWHMEPGAILLVGTDGIWDPVGGGTGPVARLLVEQLRPGPPDPLQFARVVDFSRETFDDDRTLVAVWGCGFDAALSGR